MVGLFRFLNRPSVGRQGLGSLPWNGTEGEMREEDAIAMLEDCPGLRYVIEAGLRALEDDDLFDKWLLSIWTGDRDQCEAEERRIADALAPDEQAWATLR
jgi:hypothetical protein